MAHPTCFFPESRPPTVHVVYLTRWSGCFQAPIPWTFPRFTAPRPMRVLKMWMWGSFFCSKTKKPIHLARQFDDLLDLLDDLIIIIRDSPLFQSWICMLNDWVTSCFPRAGLWDLFRCLELSLESGDWGNDLWAYPVEIDIFSTKINVNKISEWEKTYGNLWCFTGIIVFHF